MASNLSVVNGKSATTSLGPGVTPYKLIASGVSADQNLVAAGSRVLYSISASNANAALRYVKLYNKATAPVVGTDIPTCVFAIPPSNSVNLTFNAGIEGEVDRIGRRNGEDAGGDVGAYDWCGRLVVELHVSQRGVRVAGADAIEHPASRRHQVLVRTHARGDQLVRRHPRAKACGGGLAVDHG